jgi:hypothetical protein
VVELLTIGDIRHGLSEVPGQHLTKAPRVVKRMNVDEEFVVGGMSEHSLNICHSSTVLSARVVDYVATFTTFAIMLRVEDERDVLTTAIRIDSG